MRDYGEWARNSVRVWMRSVMADKGWSANEWATLAGTSATNITRMLSPVSKTVPSVDTIAKLATVAGTQPALCTAEAAKQVAAFNANFCPQCGYDLRLVAKPPQPHDQTPRAGSAARRH